MVASVSESPGVRVSNTVFAFFQVADGLVVQPVAFPIAYGASIAWVLGERAAIDRGLSFVNLVVLILVCLIILTIWALTSDNRPSRHQIVKVSKGAS